MIGKGSFEFPASCRIHTFNEILAMKVISRFALPICLFFMMASCHHDADLSVEPPKPPPPGPEFKCSHDTIYFYNSVLPVILSGCAKTGCHDQASRKGDHVLDNYNDISRLVRPFDPQSSKLYVLLFSNSEGRMPPKDPFSLDKKSIIYWWIKQGGYNNRCDSTGCDSVNVTYTLTINPILQGWCVGCHGGSNPANGLSLETYNEAVSCANSGRLMGAIRQEASFYAMPKGGEKLSPCEIALFQKWINTGTP
ncbi:MAG: c-type cytochrome domain-containing protein [Bacteroidota bacterium]